MEVAGSEQMKIVNGYDRISWIGYGSDLKESNGEMLEVSRCTFEASIEHLM